MPTNQQRRDAANRKLERQLASRQERGKARRQRLTIVSVVAAVVAIALVVWVIQANSGSDDNTADPGAAPSAPVETPAVTETVETIATAPAVDGSCAYVPDGSADGPAAPSNLDPSTEGVVPATMTLNSGVITMNLDRAAAPCTVNSLVSLAAQGYFDGTICHRLTTSPSLEVLQCGDPTGIGSGGPGYSFADENLGRAAYSRGVIAMANAGPNTNGSQFFLIYGEAQLPQSYTVIGTMDDASLEVLDAIAAKGTSDGGPDGAPAETVTIESVTVPEAEVNA